MGLLEFVLESSRKVQLLISVCDQESGPDSLQSVPSQLGAPEVGQLLNACFSGHIFLHPEDTFGSVVRLGLVEQVELLQQPLVLLVVQLTEITDIPPPTGYPDKR